MCFSLVSTDDVIIYSSYFSFVTLKKRIYCEWNNLPSVCYTQLYSDKKLTSPAVSEPQLYTEP